MSKALSIQTTLVPATLVVAMFFVLSLGVGAHAAHAAITNQLDIGSTGGDVTQLQNYLATQPAMYPSGLVTSYFGGLTAGGVQKFQTANGIVSGGTPATTGYGRVGPTTIAALNEHVGGSPVVSYDWSPIISSSHVSYTTTTATFTWNTNVPTQGQVYWDTSMIQANETTGPRQQAYVSGTLALDAGGLQTNHTVVVSNLERGTNYSFLIRSVDSAGRASLLLPSTFQTNN